MRDIYCIKPTVLRGVLKKPGTKITVENDQAQYLIENGYCQVKKPTEPKSEPVIDRSERSMKTR